MPLAHQQDTPLAAYSAVKKEGDPCYMIPSIIHHASHSAPAGKLTSGSEKEPLSGTCAVGSDQKEDTSLLDRHTLHIKDVGTIDHTNRGSSARDIVIALTEKV